MQEHIHAYILRKQDNQINKNFEPRSTCIQMRCWAEAWHEECYNLYILLFFVRDTTLKNHIKHITSNDLATAQARVSQFLLKSSEDEYHEALNFALF